MSKHEFLLAGEPVDSSVEKQGETYLVEVGDRVFELQPLGSGLYSTVVEGRRKTVAAVVNKGTIYVDIDSAVIELHEPSEDGFAGGAGDHEGEKDKIFAPMPGKIVKIMVEVGDSVEPRQQVVIVEAMKMENPVLARATGKVRAVNFSPGDQVDTDTPIVELELEE